MAGRRVPGWQDLLLNADCDVWLLTEVSEDAEFVGYQPHWGEDRMAARRHWSAVFSRIVNTLPSKRSSQEKVTAD